jgi:23S rRNA pseudouridine955/2504/2580 synthase
LATSCKNIVIDDSAEGQRLDNFVFSKMKGVPKSRIYKAIRNGEVRVCSKRKKHSYKLLMEDIVRLPPIRVADDRNPDELLLIRLSCVLADNILYEDDELLVLNKPSGISVHAGTNQPVGVIEALRYSRSELKFLELGHRLDRATSGVLVLLKSRKSLLEFQKQLNDKNTIKKYSCLVNGVWPQNTTIIDKPIAAKLVSENNKKMIIDSGGKQAITLFKIIEKFKNHTLIEATLKTGRTHQIRVHTASISCPVVGDDKYNLIKYKMASNGIMLHASTISFAWPNKKTKYNFSAPFSEGFNKCIEEIKNTNV